MFVHVSAVLVSAPLEYIMVGETVSSRWSFGILLI